MPLELSLFLLLGILLLLPTAYAAKIGAPYAPTFIAAIKKTFDYIGVDSSDVLVDLGAGDGKVLIEATRRGARAIGYELSPIMWAIAWIRLQGRGRGARVKLNNFFNQTLPADTTLIFTFLMPENMHKIDTYLQKQKLPQLRFLLAYAFPIKERDPVHVVRTEKCAPVYIYDLTQ